MKNLESLRRGEIPFTKTIFETQKYICLTYSENPHGRCSHKYNLISEVMTQNHLGNNVQ